MAAPTIWATPDGGAVATPHLSTRAGLQAALDSGGGSPVKVYVGPGTLETDTAEWIHSYTHLQGAGRGLTTIRRADGSQAGGAANSGCVIGTSAHGSNGTLATASSIQYEITLSDLTLDGNYQNNTYSAATHQAGILAQAVDGLRIHRVMVKNTFRSAYMLGFDKNVECSDVEADTVGQEPSSTTKNAFDFYNYNHIVPGHGINYRLNNFRVKDVGDEAISLTAASDVAISNGEIDGCDFVCEFQGDDQSHGVQNVVVTNITAKNTLSTAFPFFWFSGEVHSDVLVSNCMVEGHPTNHVAGAISLTVSSSESGYAERITFSDCHFTNLNSANNAGRRALDMYQSGSSASPHRFITFRNVQLHISANATSGMYGFAMDANSEFVDFEHCLVENASIAHYLSCRATTFATNTMRHIKYDHCRAVNAGNHGWYIGANLATGIVRDVEINHCEVVDAGLVSAGSKGIIIQEFTGVGATSRVTINNFRARKIAAGANFNGGIQIEATSGTVDDVTITHPVTDFTTSHLGTSGTPTNIQLTPRTRRGTDIASAATISIPADGTTFRLTGTTNITAITHNLYDNGRTATLIPQGSLTFLGVAVVANDAIQIASDGAAWRLVNK